MTNEGQEYIKYLLDTYPVRARYTNILTQVQDILEAMGILDKVSINTVVLGKAILDYFEDVDKLKKYEGIKNINVDKIYGYETFWLLRRSPIQLLDDKAVDPKYLHINEKVFVAIMIAKMLKEKKINIDDCGESLLPLMELLYYNFKYRVYTQKSLEMTVTAFFCGCDMAKCTVCKGNEAS